MTPYEYVLRSWEMKDTVSLAQENGWSLYAAWQVYQAVKAKQPLQDIYRISQEHLMDGLVQRVATNIQTNYLAWLKKIELLGDGK